MTDWSPLRAALKRCRDANLALPLWWRDDDATTETSALDKLEMLSEKLGISVNLAVIPKLAKPDLAVRVNATDIFTALVHGWEHANHAPPDAKKSEFGTHRAGATRELNVALATIQNLFGAKALPLFVPPWNRIHPEYHPQLKRLGYRVLSTFAPRAQTFTDEGIYRINTHIDPIDWHGSRGLISTDVIVSRTVAHLEARLDGREDVEEPLGYLTHHLVHNEDIWAFSEAYLSEMLAGGAQPHPLPSLLERPK